MSGKMDTIRGRLKEAAGALVDDPELKKEGQLDQEVGKKKEAAARLSEKVSKNAAKAARRVEQTARDAQASVEETLERATTPPKKD